MASPSFSKEGEEISTLDSSSTNSNPTVEFLQSNPNNGGRKMRKRVAKSVSGYSTSTSSSTSQWRSLRRRRVLPRVMANGGNYQHGQKELDALALPLGMSIAVVVAQVIDKKNASDESIPADHLSLVFGDRFDCFVKNFEKSFGSTLSTLRLINGTSLDKEDSSLRHSRMKSKVTPTICRGKEALSIVEEIEEFFRPNSINGELALQGRVDQRLACSSLSSLGPVSFRKCTQNTFEKSVMEQARSNDLKTFEIGLMMKQMQMKESKLALNSDLNRLERFKLSLGISKAVFKAEKFKTQLEETRHVELLNKCIDCLVAGLLIMPASLTYGAYIYSYQRITDITSSCTTPPKEPKSWWMPKPISSFSDGWSTVWCHAQVWGRILIALLFLGAASLLFLRSGVAAKKMMPVTFILLLLGGGCSIAGKFCIDTLGGNGYIWVLYWETLCLLHFFANICTSALFYILHGPVSVSGGANVKPMFPYWIRRFVFYATILVFLPLFCGLMPFASPSQWGSHFFSLSMEAHF
ncbi:hypothetical protein GIB67_022662 [Kingdonia uniflora]|uniref:CPR5 n=1 Tax=Kingdonia uniflora TaxID=39325 RepID=A0A7J7P8J2_9MAGN|nr:hypothetical protein GIB67_022662 [Kingdonia uniflora]